MLVRHSLLYLLARGLPGFINFLAVMVYTRLLGPEEYGQYTLALTGAATISGILFWWLSASLERFVPANLDRLGYLLSTAATSFLAVSFVAVSLGIIVGAVVPGGQIRSIVFFVVLLLPLLAWHDINLALARSQLDPFRYTLLGVLKTSVSLGLGAVFILIGFHAYGPLLGIAMAAMVAGVIGLPAWKGARIGSLDPALLRGMLRFGLPLAATFALGFVVSFSDRFMISGLIGIHNAGLYAAGYDLAQQSIEVLMLVVFLAAYPLIVRTLEQSGPVAAREQLKRYVYLLLSVTIPAVIGLAMLSENIAQVLLGEAFREMGAKVMPWIALAAAIAGVKAFYFDLAFALGKRTLLQVWVALVAAVLNVGLNVWLIPIAGVLGAAYATLAAFSVAAVTSWALGRGVFQLPTVSRDAIKIILASSGMAIVLSLISSYRGLGALVWQVALGLATYVVLAFALDMGNVRSRARMLFGPNHIG